MRSFSNKHAYLVIAHNNWNQLGALLSLLDDNRNDIYLHIDKRSKHVPIDIIKNSIKQSRLYIFQEYKIYWGHFSQVKCELFLFEKASSEYKYIRYHVISGADLPIKSQDYIHNFFQKYSDYEFVHFDTKERLKNDPEIQRRTKLYHFLQKYRRRYRIKLINSIFTFLERILLAVQIVFRVNRLKNCEFKIYYGSNWISITDDLVCYILSKKDFINKVFKWTNCADELFVQTLVYNSSFRNKLYHKNLDDSQLANMRLIDWYRGKNGNPYIWKYQDKSVIENSQCLFARKFDVNVDKNIIDSIIQNYKLGRTI